MSENLQLNLSSYVVPVPVFNDVFNSYTIADSSHTCGTIASDLKNVDLFVCVCVCLRAYVMFNDALSQQRLLASPSSFIQT